MAKVRTRFAPSPTGNPHIGNIRTALFDYLLAKHSGGEFILRIEDTDKSREVEGSVETILQSLTWIGLTWDEGPYIQSQRLEIYKDYVNQLLDKNLAYKREGAVYFKTLKDGQTKWVDLVGNKQISFENKIIDDFIILKSDGYPTYHLASVIDDHLMEITHVTRGEDWISSTPKHLMLYTAFGWTPPRFGHFPNVLATDRSKLSKRHGAIGVFDFKRDGYLPEALRNYIALLGWAPASGTEILSLQEMVEQFKIEDVNVAAAVFDIRKLDWMNGEYIRAMTDDKLTKRLQDYLVDHPAREKIAVVVPLIKDRIVKLSDFILLTDFIFEKPEYDIEEFKKIKIENQKEVLEKISETLQSLDKPWSSVDFEKRFRDLAAELNIKAGDIFQLLRIAVSGQLVTPPLYESIKIIGEDQTLDRVEKAAECYPNFDEVN